MAGAGRGGGCRHFLAVLLQPGCGLGCVGTVFFWELRAGHAGVVGGGFRAATAGGRAAVSDDGGAGAACLDVGFQEPDCGGAQRGVCTDAARAGAGSVRRWMVGGELAREEFVFDLFGALPDVPDCECGVYAVCAGGVGVPDSGDRTCMGGELGSRGVIFPLG